MANDTDTTTPRAAELHFLKSDRLALQAVLDFFDKAMTFEGTFYTNGVSINSPLGMAFGDAIASAWANCTNALRNLLLMPKLNTHIREAAERLQELTPEQDMEEPDFRTHFDALFGRSLLLRKRDHGLSTMLLDAACVFHVYEANMKLREIRNNVPPA